MWTIFFKEEEFLEFRAGALKELKEKLKHVDLLHKHYERDLGADKVKQIRAEVSLKLGLQSGVSPWNSSDGETATLSEPMPSDSNTNTKPAAKDTSGGLLGVGSHGTLVVGASSDRGVNRQTPKVTRSPPSQSKSITKKKKTHTDTSNDIITVSARKYAEGDENNASGTAVELLNSQWATTMIKHRRAADSDSRFGPLFNCVCGFNSSSKQFLESHVKEEIFGKIFQCPHQNCNKSFNNFYYYRLHELIKHGIVIENEEGCSLCGTQFREHRELEGHSQSCPGRFKLDVAMKM